VYQENAAVAPTLTSTYTTHNEKIQANAFAKDSFFGAAAL
jgi:hypothetical protein